MITFTFSTLVVGITVDLVVKNLSSRPVHLRFRPFPASGISPVHQLDFKHGVDFSVHLRWVLKHVQELRSTQPNRVDPAILDPVFGCLTRFFLALKV